MVEQKPPTQNVPEEMICSILREYTRDETARITHLEISEVKSHRGHMRSDIYSVQISWMARDGDRSENWVAKKWHPDRATNAIFGFKRSSEALSCIHGIFPHRISPGVVTPFIGARIEPDDSAWIVMENVGKELDEYATWGKDPEREISRARHAVNRISRLHDYWRAPDRFAVLKAHAWLPSYEQYVMGGVDIYRRVLNQRPLWRRELPESTMIEYRSSTHAFLDCIPSRDLPLWEKYLCNRQPFIDALAKFPQTLFHGDFQDQNVGLRWTGSATDDLSECDLVLIDWEFMGRGPVFLDVGERLLRLDMIDEYVERYSDSDDISLSRAQWEEGCRLAQISHFLTWIFVVGFRIQQRGPDTAKIVAQVAEAIAELMRQLLPHQDNVIK